MPPFHLQELVTESEFAAMWPLIHQLNPTMEEAIFTTRLANMRAQGNYRCLAAVDTETGRYIGLCGFWIGTRLWCGRYVDLDNVIVDETARSAGVGRAMLAWIEDEAKRQGCALAVLDTYTTYHEAHRFYFRAGYHIEGYHMIKRLN